MHEESKAQHCSIVFDCTIYRVLTARILQERQLTYTSWTRDRTRAAATPKTERMTVAAEAAVVTAGD